MPQSRERLERALIAADAAGDIEAATALARALKDYAQPAEEPKRGTVADAAAQGATLGFADEIVGLAGAAVGALDPRLAGTTFGERYSGIRDAARENKRQFSERNPKTAIGAEIGGALLTGGIGLKGMAAKGGASLPRLAGVGAGVGGVAGLGHSEADTIGGMAADSAIGAGVGAVAGALLPPVAKAAGKAIAAPFQYIAADRNARAAGKIAQAIGRDDMTPEMLAARLAKRPQGSVIADVGGANVQGLARDITIQPGRAQNIARQLFEGRRRLAPQRIDSAIRSTLGLADEQFHASKDALAAQMKMAAKPLYEQAYQQPVRMTPKLRAVLNRPSMREALQAGRRMASEEGDVIGGNIQLLDYAKRALDDKIGVALRAGESQKARALISTRNALLNELDDQIPVYAKARAAYAGPKALDDALEAGRKFIREDAEDIGKMLAGMSPSEKEFFRIGAVRQVRDLVLSKSDTANAYRSIFDSPLKREKVQALFPNAKEFAKFARAMRSEAEMFRTSTAVTANSNTASKLAGVDDLKMDPGVMVDLATGHPSAAAFGALREWLRKHAPSLRNEKMRAEIAEMLFTADKNQQQLILQRIGAPSTIKSLSDIPPLARLQVSAAGAQIGVSQSN